MNNKTLKILAITAFILGIVSICVYKNKSKSWENNSLERGTPLFKEFDINSINKIKISFVDRIFLIEKKDSKWILPDADNYPADFEKIKENLLTISEMQITQVINLEDEKKENELFHLGDNKSKKPATKLELIDDNNQTKSLLIGGYHYPIAEKNLAYSNQPDPNGRYIKKLDTKKKVYIVSEVLRDIYPVTPIWMKKSFITLSNPQRIQYQNEEKSIDWDIIRPNDKVNFLLVRPYDKKLDVKKINEFIHNLFSPRFRNVKKFIKFSEEDKIIGTINYKNFDKILFILKVIKRDKRYFIKYDIDSKDIEKIKDKKLKEKAIKQAEKDQFFTNWLYEVDAKFIENLNKSIFKEER